MGMRAMGIRAWHVAALVVAALLSLSTAALAQAESLPALSAEVDKLYNEGKYQDAEPVAKKALELARQQNAPPVIAAAMDRLALVYKVLGRFEEAEPLYRGALDIHRKLPFDPDLPSALNNLAQLYDAQGRYEEAEPLYKRALDLWEKAVGPDDALVGTVCSNIGQLYDHQARYAEAEPFLLRALKIRKAALPAGDIAIARTMNNLALVYEHQGRYDEAEPLYKDALAIAEKALAPDHPTTARIRENLGGFYKSRGRRTEAETLLKSALAAKEKTYGSVNRALASTLAQLGDLYRLEGKCPEAEQHFTRARSVAGGAIKEVPVLFGTDRARETGEGAPAFGNKRGKTISYGLNVVQVASAEPAPSSTRQGIAAKGVVAVSSSDADAANRLPQHCHVAAEDLGKLFEEQGRTTGKPALVFVHGYRVDFDGAARRAAQIAYDTNFDGNMFVFSWPSKAEYGGYFLDSQSVNVAEADLYTFLQQILRAAKPTKIHFIAHSMGNMVLLRALERLTSDSKLRPLLGEVITASPDVDPEYYVMLADKINGMDGASDPASTAAVPGRVTLYAAQSDWALWLSSWIWGARAGLIYDSPLVTPGVDTIDVTNAGGDDFFQINHDIYVSSPVIVGDMRRIIEGVARPPDKRTTQFQAFASPNGPYWGLPKAAK